MTDQRWGLTRVAYRNSAIAASRFDPLGSDATRPLASGALRAGAVVGPRGGGDGGRVRSPAATARVARQTRARIQWGTDDG